MLSQLVTQSLGYGVEGGTESALLVRDGRTCSSFRSPTLTALNAATERPPTTKTGNGVLGCSSRGTLRDSGNGYRSDRRSLRTWL